MAKTPDLTGFAIPRKGEAAPAAQQQPGPTPAPVQVQAPEVRTTVSTRLGLAVQERLRRYAFEAKRDKQGIIEDALADYLKARGF